MIELRASNLGQWMKKLHAKPKNLNLIPGTYMVEREKQLPNAAFLTPNVNTPHSLHKLK